MSALTNAGLSLTISGKDYTIRPLTFADLEWLELRFRARIIEMGRLSIPEGTPQAKYDIMMGPVMDRAEKLNIMENLDQLITPTGFVWAVYRMFVSSHPDVTMADVQGWMHDPEVSSQLAAALPLMLGFKKSQQQQQKQLVKPAVPRKAKSRPKKKSSRR